MKITSKSRLSPETQVPAPAFENSPSVVAELPATPAESPWLQHPVPSASNSAPRSGQVDGPAALSPLRVQLQHRVATDGAIFLRERLRMIEEKSAKGEPVMVVFDLDNTLFDTRARTLRAAKDFDALHRTTWFAQLELHQVQIDGEQTARNIQEPPLPEIVVTAFAEFWEKEFWNPDNLRHDGDMPEMIHWAKAAQAAGAEVRYLTGRTAGFHGASLAQLRNAGLKVEPSQLCCKPSVDVRTAPFKSSILQAWGESMPIAWFLTEGLRDLAHVQQTLPELATVRLDCSFEDDRAHPLAPHTPRLPRVF